MSEFKNVTVVKNVNAYFEGNVTSRTIIFDDGTKKTLGVMLPGEYEFSTGDKELMEILSGKGKVRLKGAKNDQVYGAGYSFEVPSRSSFMIMVDELTDYCCSFIAD
ncbi:MAG: pyrimidine/purine nucleoside phosphorylase [Desulfobulbaceae bacterium]|nr:pyrimidine/purine nucleoside phosphorylase [Desulfobulbaceae bacterium]